MLVVHNQYEMQFFSFFVEVNESLLSTSWHLQIIQKKFLIVMLKRTFCENHAFLIYLSKSIYSYYAETRKKALNNRIICQWRSLKIFVHKVLTFTNNTFYLRNNVCEIFFIFLISLNFNKINLFLFLMNKCFLYLQVPHSCCFVILLHRGVFLFNSLTVHSLKFWIESKMIVFERKYCHFNNF